MSMILSTYHVRFRPGAADCESATIDGYRLEGWTNDYAIFGNDGEPRIVYPRAIVQSIDRLPFEGPDSPQGRPYWENLEHCCQTLRSWIESDLIRFVSLEKLWKSFEEVEDQFDDKELAVDPNIPVEDVPDDGGEIEQVKRGRLFLYTEENKYSITFRPSQVRRGTLLHDQGPRRAGDKKTDAGYLGCVVSKRKSRAGEDWTRGRDLADGEMSFKTWRRIVSDMLSFELIEPAEKLPAEKIIEIDEEGDVVPTPELGSHRGKTTSP